MRIYFCWFLFVTQRMLRHAMEIASCQWVLIQQALKGDNVRVRTVSSLIRVTCAKQRFI